MNKQEVLIIDDEAQIRKLLEIALESNGYKVLMAVSGKEGIVMAATHPPQIILLDIGLPDMSGHDVLNELRRWYSGPIIILSVQKNETDIVSALDNGATDYLTKPFRTAELLARMRSAIRRNQQESLSSVFECGEIVVDISARTVKKNGLILKLTTTEYLLMVLFVRNEGRVLTHQYLLKEIWGVGAQLETQYLRVFIGTLRKKIEDDHTHPKYLITESGVGYRLSKPISL